MAKEVVKESDIDKVVRVVSGRTSDQRISSILDSQTGVFPSASDIDIDTPYVNEFEPPKWCDTENYSYAWLDIEDEVQLNRALNYEYWQLVTRSNHPQARSVDFKVHGAVERLGMVLAYRPKDLDTRLRFLGVKRHLDMVQGQVEGNPQYDRRLTISDEGITSPSSGGLKVSAYEPAGEHVKDAKDLSRGDL